MTVARTYNILGKSLGKVEMYPNTPLQDLTWDERGSKLLK
jgi:mRNA deadenylase 3'-5' endonuclease subunit Ccr4